MRIAILLLLSLFLFGCAGTKKVDTAKADTSKKIVLPPDTASNKYSKTRQGN